MSIKYIIFWAILLRFIVMPFFFHPDLKDHHQRVNYLSTQGVLNIYEFLRQDSYTKEHNLDFSYPPLTYFTLGFYQYLISPILGNDFQKWTRDYSDFRYDTPLIFRYLFSLKFIYLIFELLTGLIIYKLLLKSSRRNLALALWFFNPINLYAISAIGQFDIIPTFFTILSFFLWNKKKIFYSGLSLGIAVAFKTYPLLFLPFFLLTKETVKNKVIFLLTSLGIYGITILPFVNSKAFQNDVLFSGLSTRIFQLKVTVADYQVSVFMVLFLLLIMLYGFLRSKIPLYIFITATLALVFSTARFHPQWIIWIMPFLTIAYGENRINLRYISLFAFSYFLYFIFFGDSFLTTGLLSPISTLYLEIPSFTKIVPDIYQNYIGTMTQSFFAVVSLIIVIKLLRGKKITP
ncbi:hypothetical protein A3D83_01035 [Candidatus Daviesbacteria bacterium RIFCSPHIGHO2_02_FULL_41_10]|uniref:Mannosyltransferase n=1 Tax=Candidatus Daviesbacteria bacterium RIFCSPHIGHO2_02_FULL_41_10 TaxID=1797774 RepID=A0A1F5JY22_9BACT|nr:MAG: hypothetical protein A3D83_01035 [Candidatus Daviesbacteria bacterium RIFCSPHIGHO2_02_FULL_41_10]